MVSPILANAEPKAKFREDCILLFLAARIAAIPSGNNTTAAIITPTKLLGAPKSSTKPSMVGDKAFAIKTTTAKHKINNPKLIKVLKTVGGSAVSISSFSLTTIK